MMAIKSTWPENLYKANKSKRNSFISVLQERPKTKTEKVQQEIERIRAEIWRNKMARLNKKS